MEYDCAGSRVEWCNEVCEYAILLHKVIDSLETLELRICCCGQVMI